MDQSKSIILSSDNATTSTTEAVYQYDEASYYVSLIIISCFFGYLLTIVYGIPCNLYVVYRMLRHTRKSNDMYSNGAGRCLLLMAVADIGSLVAIFCFIFLNVNDDQFITMQESTALIVCKIATFAMHTCTFISIWSWTLMSTLRYVSIYYPFIYIRLWKLPHKVLVTIVLSAILINLWVFVSVIDVEKKNCTFSPILGSNLPPFILLFVDSFFSFVIPCLTIVYVDVSVLWSLRFSRLLVKADIRRNASSERKLNPYMTRWLLIALIDVCLNAPENVMRLLVIARIVEYRYNDVAFIAFRHISQLLYYAQFGYNCVYLAVFIYDKPVRPTINRRIWESQSAVEMNSERSRAHRTDTIPLTGLNNNNRSLSEFETMENDSNYSPPMNRSIN